MYSGTQVQEPSSQVGRGARIRAVAQDDVGGQAHLAGRVRTGRDDRLAHRRVPRQGGLDLAELDAESADLDLVIDPAEALERPVGPPAGEVAGAVEAAARRACRTGRG